MMQEHEEYISKEVEIDYRVHAKLFGPKGKVIADIKTIYFNVVRFPLGKKSNKITRSSWIQPGC